jgi:hypothetical protein
MIDLANCRQSSDRFLKRRSDQSSDTGSGSIYIIYLQELKFGAQRRTIFSLLLSATTLPTVKMSTSELPTVKMSTSKNADCQNVCHHIANRQNVNF